MVSTVTNDRCREYRGLSSDTKPTEIADGISIGNGSIFFEIDTCKVFMFNETAKAWVELA